MTENQVDNTDDSDYNSGGCEQCSYGDPHDTTWPCPNCGHDWSKTGGGSHYHESSGILGVIGCLVYIAIALLLLFSLFQ
ncbi:MAG: hypothetical protein Q8Q23_03345 [bacterium]|nr:hypothetical protein [bacterium]